MDNIEKADKALDRADSAFDQPRIKLLLCVALTHGALALIKALIEFLKRK